MLQLRPPIWLETPKGVGLAHFVTWDSLEHSLHWTVFLQNGQIWTFENEEVRACKNITVGRVAPEGAGPNPEAMKRLRESLDRGYVPIHPDFLQKMKAIPPLVRKKKRA